MKKILVIEDDLMVRTVIIDILEAEDFIVIAGEDGIIGLEKAQEYLPNLIICDVMMPRLDGYGVLKAIRQNESTRAIPFIFLTAKSTKADQRQGMEEGADDYLTKPFSRDELLKAIASRLQKQEILERRTQSRLDELRSNITMYLPHELRTPLNGIIASSEFLLEEFTTMNPEEIREMLHDISFSAQRLYRLIQNFLMYADLELILRDPERLKSLHKAVVNKPEVVIKNMAKQVAQKPEFHRENDLILNLSPGQIKITESSLQKIVEEIIDNALKFSEPGTVVQVTGEIVGDRYLIEVVDKGRGIKPEQINKLGAYQQFDRKIYEQQGSGLGLAIVKRLVNLHQGELIIESIPKQQTNVRILLPIIYSNN